MGKKLGGAVPFLLEEGAVAYLHTKWHLSPSSRLATTNIGRKLGDCAPFGERELGPHLTQSRLG